MRYEKNHDVRTYQPTCAKHVYRLCSFVVKHLKLTFQVGYLENEIYTLTFKLICDGDSIRLYLGGLRSVMNDEVKLLHRKTIKLVRRKSILFFVVSCQV